MLHRYSVLLLSTFLVSCQPTIPRTWELPADVQIVKTNGYETAYTERGKGVPVVFVHGSLADYRFWAGQMEPFAAKYRAIALSLRHYYPERWNGSGDTFSIRQHAEDLAAFIEQLDAGPVHVVAHSRGGDVVLKLAATRPALFRTLILVEPAPIDSLMPNNAAADAAAGRRKNQISRTIAAFQNGDIDGGLEIFIDTNVVPGTFRKAPEPVKQMWRDNAWPLKHLLADAQVPFSCADARSINVPVLLVAGEKSPPIYGVMLDALQPCLLSSEKVTIPHATHGMARTHPQPFNAAVLAFLSRY